MFLPITDMSVLNVAPHPHPPSLKPVLAVFPTDRPDFPQPRSKSIAQYTS
jgi:hypothetical protein